MERGGSKTRKLGEVKGGQEEGGTKREATTREKKGNGKELKGAREGRGVGDQG